MLCMHLREDNSVKDFLTNNKTTIFKSDCERLCFNSELRYFYSNCESLLQIDSLHRSKVIHNLIKRIVNVVYLIIKIALKT